MQQAEHTPNFGQYPHRVNRGKHYHNNNDNKESDEHKGSSVCKLTWHETKKHRSKHLTTVSKAGRDLRVMMKRPVMEFIRDRNATLGCRYINELRTGALANAKTHSSVGKSRKHGHTQLKHNEKHHDACYLREKVAIAGAKPTSCHTELQVKKKSDVVLAAT